MATKVLIVHVGSMAEIVGYLTGYFKTTQSTVEQSYLRELISKGRMLQGTIEMLFLEQERGKKR